MIPFSVLEERIQQNRDGNSKITKRDLDMLERQLDKLFEVIGIDVGSFKGHFIDRVNDPRNKQPITIDELRELFVKVFRKYKDLMKDRAREVGIEKDEDWQAVMNDISTAINVPFLLVWDKRNQEIDLISKTILRKNNFKTSNKKLKVK